MNKPGEIPMAVFKAIARFERAAVAYPFKGSKTPAERVIIEKEYEMARQNLILKIKKAIQK